MARVTCRCGETIEVNGGDQDRVVCPRCRTRLRIRRPGGKPPAGAPSVNDGYVRFPCPCGRRLKVRATSRIEAGKCPDCGRIVPIPDSARNGVGTGTGTGTDAGGGRNRGGGGADPETRTEELDKADVARLGRWAARHGVAPEAPEAPEPADARPPRHRHQHQHHHQHHLPETPVQTPPPPAPPSSFSREAGLRVCPRCRKPLHMSATVCRSCGASTPKT